MKNKCPKCNKRERRISVMSTNSKNPNSPQKEYVRKWCSWCLKTEYEKPYREHKGNSCEVCGFTAVHECQLDVDHVDNNHENNEPSNLQTLCSNCHRLKTFINRR